MNPYKKHISITSHNPLEVFNSYISQVRNVFLLSSISFAILKFRKSFKMPRNYVVFFSTILFAYCIIYAYKTADDFSEYIEYIETHPDIHSDLFIQISKWKEWNMMTYGYIFILIVFLVLFYYHRYDK